MLKHIVFFKVRSDFSAEEKQKAIEKIVSLLSELPSKIEQIKFYEIGVNINDRESGFDVSLISGFENNEQLQIYRNHKDHLAAVEEIKKLTEKSAFVDYEMPKFYFEK